MKTIHSNIPDPTDRYPFHQPVSSLAFFDIETTGLSPRAASIYLIGAMHYDASAHVWEITQWFADDYQSEPQIIESFLAYLKDFHFLYHFNGSTFDLPFLRRKCQKHNITPSAPVSALLEAPISYQHNDVPTGHIDLLRALRPWKKSLGLAHANQTALEQWLDTSRKDTMTGKELISVYSRYMQQKILAPAQAESLEALLLLHNHDDIAGMLSVCRLLSYADALQPETPLPITDCTRFDDQMSVTFSIPVCVPRPLTLQCQEASVTFTKETAVLTLPLVHETMKYFFPNPQEYFYLPLEDTAIHKSVAQFVEPAFRRKATAATCYTKKEGTFFPSLLPRHAAASEEPLFFRQYKTLPAYHLLTDDPHPDAVRHQLSPLLTLELSAFLPGSAV